jgi:hypothetical protein
MTDDPSGLKISDSWKFSLEIATTPMPVMTSVYTPPPELSTTDYTDIKFPD